MIEKRKTKENINIDTKALSRLIQHTLVILGLVEKENKSAVVNFHIFV